ncbi:2-dehydropantoate 2-reductase N-terminal domain-containing protein [Streptomyces sp. NPDC051662]|uniref:ketopantoate reductase family protein n=1 Tax=Streptomyces sp. NPDC051662 TaxID=3154750 RepID=UPI00343D8EC1
MSCNTPSAPSILIVGAGAMGIMSGYHLRLAGAEVTFLVRPQRVEKLSRPQMLYSYDDVSLKPFSGYRLLSDVTKAGDRAYDYVIVTLDGASSRSAEGTALLNGLGDTVRDTSAVVIIGGVGLGLRRHCLDALGLDEERVISGALTLLAHQVASADLPVHPPTDPALLAQADMAYRTMPTGSFTVEDRFPAVATRFKALYDACDVSHCDIVDHDQFPAQVAIVFPVFAACELMGWPPAAQLTDHKDTWKLAVDAVREVVSLDEYAPANQASSSEFLKGMMAALEEKALPLDANAFNAFHHGGKVAQQDLELLRDHVAAGERQGKPMVTLKQLIADLTAFRQQAV